jgi:hypothetical protein
MKKPSENIKGECTIESQSASSNISIPSSSLDIIALIKKFMYPVGFCTSEPIRLNRRFVCIMISLHFGFYYCGSSVVYEWPDMKKMLQSTMTMSICVQASLRFICYIYDQKVCFEIQGFIVKFHENFDECNGKFKKVLAGNVKRLKLIFGIVFFLHCFGEFVPFCMSLYNLGVEGRGVPPFPAFLSFIDRGSLLSFWVDFAIQLFMAVMLIFANPEVDWTYVLIIFQSKSYVDSIQYDLETFFEPVDDADEKNPQNRSEHDKKIKEKLVKLVKSHCEIVDYFHLSSNFLSKQFFVLICLNIYVICSSGISLLTSEYSVALGIAFLYPIQIFFVCVLGEFVKHQHERLNDLLWKFDWHKLSTNHQKIYNFIQLNVQHPMKLEMMFIGVINLELFIRIMQMIYSYFTVMMRIIEE